uniref:Uncharacterized protein n=1 Tax=Anguilla anguilla TaxID=7936 RepID=A0A0E9TK18_ANGAN
MLEYWCGFPTLTCHIEFSFCTFKIK